MAALIDAALCDERLHALDENKIALGFNAIFNSSYSNYSHCYSLMYDEKRCVAAIESLWQLYGNFFARYCTTTYSSLQRKTQSYPSPMTELCYNFWDRFSLYPTNNLRSPILHAGIDLLENLLLLQNDHVILSVIETLCVWAFACKKRESDRIKNTVLNWKAD